MSRWSNRYHHLRESGRVAVSGWVFGPSCRKSRNRAEPNSELNRARSREGRRYRWRYERARHMAQIGKAGRISSGGHLALHNFDLRHSSLRHAFGLDPPLINAGPPAIKLKT